MLQHQHCVFALHFLSLSGVEQVSVMYSMLLNTSCNYLVLPESTSVSDSMLYLDASVCDNCCCAESGDHDALQAAVKQMLKPFKPAQDRFEGLDTERSEGNDCVVLKDAASYVSCTIKDRLEAGDHWIVYATVDDGKVLAEIDPTAVHHRKIGTTY